MEIRRFSHGPHEERLCLTILLEAVEQWGKLCCLEGGDIMHAHDIVHKRMDGRDASRPCYEQLIDRNWCHQYFPEEPEFQTSSGNFPFPLL
ncbi:hypothetical protein BGY98DRAFT_985284 [Russula aff. rugulosa BPL654]|nr:hypothetical protein BGY98DRAFT_985284 [Russula aff. rugulosa BPL654]